MAVDPFRELRKAIDEFVRKIEGAGGGGGGRGARIPAGMVGITIVDDSNENARGLSRIFDAFDTTIAEIPDVLREAIPTVREAHRANFTTEGAAGRGRWAALAPSTLRERARLGFGPGPILVRTGELRDHVLSAPAKITRRGRTVELRIQPGPVVGGVPKYVANALGTSRIPPRPMVTVGPAGATRITSTISRSLRARARANGLS